jgi:hypothetical protein
VTDKRVILLAAAAVCALAGCSNQTTSQERLNQREQQVQREFDMSDESFFDLFRDRGDADRGVVVNRYLWQASLDILSFLPLEGADPFSGLIVTGWGRAGTAPGAYRVTVYISDPALDARSLKVAAFAQQGGRAVPVTAGQNNQLEDAILTRARQLRIAAAERRG